MFGRAASTENPGFRVERFWSRYRFEGTPVTLFVGAELKKVSQAGIFGNDDPGIGVEVEFGDLELSAKAYIERESQRLGLQNDNDLVSYVFTAAYNLKPHRFGFDVAYFRDRFFGADTAAVGCDRTDIGCSGQKTDSVWIDASWTGRFGPVRALLQGNVILGTAEGGTAGLPAGVLNGREYDIFAGSVIGYVEVDLGVVRPFLLGVYGTPDGDPRDRQLRGFGDVQPRGRLDAMGHAICWAISIGVRRRGDGGTIRVRRGCAGCGPKHPRTTPMPSARQSRTARLLALLLALPLPNVTIASRTSGMGNSGSASHVGIVSHLLEPGDAACLGGVKDFPAKGHEITGWYAYRGTAHSGLLETAFAPEIQAGTIRKIRRDLYHEIGGYWQWTLNPHFDIRWRGTLRLPAMAPETWRTWPTVTRQAAPAGPVKGKPRRCGGMPASGRASSDLSPSSHRESGSPDSLALLCTVSTRRPQVGQKSVHFGLFYAMKTPG